MKQNFKRFILAFITMIAGTVAFAQVTTSSIAGHVADRNGAVAGAPVIAVYQPTGASYYALTDNRGNYRINGIVPGGPYTVSVEMLGYRKVETVGVYAPLAEVITVDTQLEEEYLNLDAAVFVADGSDSNMNIRRSGAGTNIGLSKIESVPTVSRSMNDVMALTPQASISTNGIAVGGGNYRGSSVTVDGAAFNNAFGIGQNLPAGGSPISLDAIEQMSINITPFDVRQSGFQGSAINAVTKSGSNQYHASLYDYYTTEKLRGGKVAGEDVANSKTLNHTIGMTAGGPVVKNKLFFFVNAEYTFDDVPGSSKVARDNASQEWGGDLMYNRPTMAQMETMKSFVGDRFGYNPGRYQGFSLKTPDYKVLARLDWQIHPDHKLTTRFSYTHTYGSNPPSTSMAPLGGNDSEFESPTGETIKFNRNSAGRQSAYALYYESARYYQEQNFMSVAAELNSRLFNGKGSNMFRATWSHQDEPRSYVGSYFPTVDILSTEGVTGSNTHAILTTIGMDPFTYGNLRDVKTITLTDEFSYSADIHNLLGGVQYEWNRATNGFMQGGAGWFIYDSWEAFENDVKDKSGAPSAFMITHANLDDPTSQAFPQFDYSQVSLYAQDEMNISDYFKLTAGLRLEIPRISNPNDNYNKDFAAIAAKFPNSSFGGLSTSDLPKTRVSFSPRIGFNWDVLKDRSLVIRGGTGIYTGRIPNVWLVSAMGNANVLQYQYIANKSTGNPVVHFSNDRSEIINNIWASQGGFQKADLTAPTNTTIIAKDLKMPSSWKSSLAVDVRLPWGVKGTLEGIYSYNFNEVYATSLGYVKSSTTTLPGEPSPRSVWSSEGVRNDASTPINSNGAVVHGYYVRNVNDAHGSYYSVMAQLSKTFDWGLDLMAAYTRSGAKTLSDGGGDQISEFANINTINGVNEPMLGNAYYVSPNRVIANASYTIKEGIHAATRLSVFYEGYHIGYISSYSYSRNSYLMNNVSGAGSATQLIYIPTASELQGMPFVTEANRSAYETFISEDSYLSKHRGEYSRRNGAAAPWLNRINVRVAQDIYFNIAGRRQTVEIGLDIKNVGNLLNSKWGVYKQLSSNEILSYDDYERNPSTLSLVKDEGGNNIRTGTYRYTFTKPTWNNYNNIASTWQMLLSARYFF